MNQRKKFKIGLDARTLNVKGGSKTYATNLISHLEKKRQLILFGINKYNNLNCIPSKIKSSSLLRLFYENFSIPYLMKKNNIILFHGLKGVVPFFGQFKKIATVHDMIYYIHPEQFKITDLLYWKYITKIYLKKCNKIIAVSKSTKNDLIKYLGINPSIIKVIYEGFSREIYKQKNKLICYSKIKRLLKEKEIFIKNIKNKKIILNVNTIQPRKNISNLIKAFDPIAKKDKSIILIIIGKKGWKYKKIFETYEHSKNKERIYFLDFVSDELVSCFYNISNVFVYPSFYEGFGLPILEAQACGCPVITSNISSMPEITGTSAILINPYNTQEITKAIFKIINNKTIEKDFIKKGLRNIEKFSWDKCAKETLKIYEEVYNEK